MLDRAWPRRTALLLIAAAAGVAYGWQANRDTLEIYYAVARLAGPAAGLIAAAVLAVSPATVASAGLIGHDEGALDTPFEPVPLARNIDTTTTTLTQFRDVTAPRLEDGTDGDPDLAAAQTSALASVLPRRRRSYPNWVRDSPAGPVRCPGRG